MPGRLGPYIPAGRVRSAAPGQLPSGMPPGAGNMPARKRTAVFFVYIMEEKNNHKNVSLKY